MQTIEKYQHAELVMKNYEDGSSAILKKIPVVEEKDLTFRVCGVNWNQCVFETVRGLLSCGFDVTADSNCSNPDYVPMLGSRWEDVKQMYRERLAVV